MAKRILLVILVLWLAAVPVSNAAIVTQPFSEFADGLVVINFDHNTGSGNVLRFRCINQSDYAARLRVLDCPEGQSCTLMGEQLCPAHGTLEINVPGVSVAWQCVPMDPDHPEWGLDCGLAMGTKVFQSQWPAE